MPECFTLTPKYHVAGVRGYTLRLYCDEPGAWHPVPGERGCYAVKDLDPWLSDIASHVLKVSKLLSVAATIAARSWG